MKKIKKNASSVSKMVQFDFSVKKDADKEGGLFIEGYANRAMIGGEKVVDRGKEHIPAGEWKIDEWKKNPIIFFNHDRDIPIGQGVAAKVDENGLWIKAKISMSEAPDIKKVRDLIEEGILRTFSVGIDVGGEEMVGKDEIHLKDVNLLETSVVSIPMNQESFFSISKKSLAEDNLDKIGHDILKAKGALVAAAIHQRIYDLQSEDNGFNRADALVSIASSAEVSQADLMDALAGNTSVLSEELLDATAQVLEMDISELQELNKVDEAVANSDSSLQPEEEPEEEEGEESEEGVMDEEEDKEDSKEPMEGDEEENKAKAEQAPDEEEDSEDEELVEPEEDSEEPMQGDEGEEEELVDPDEEELEEDPEDEELGADLEEAVDRYNEERLATEEGGEGNPPSWVADEAAWEKAKRASEEAFGEVRYGFVSWFYQNVLGASVKEEEMELEEEEDLEAKAFYDFIITKIKAGVSEGLNKEAAIADGLKAAMVEGYKEKLTPTQWSKILDSLDGKEEEAKPPMVPMGTTDQIDVDKGQPTIQALQQITVLLGQLIAETQKTQKLLEGMGNMDSQLGISEESEELEEDEDMPLEEGDEEENSKSLDIIGNYREKLDKKLSRFDV
jgi:HK97 family phage prohead protease